MRKSTETRTDSIAQELSDALESDAGPNHELNLQLAELGKEKEHLSKNLAELKGEVGEYRSVLDHVRQLEASAFGARELAPCYPG